MQNKNGVYTFNSLTLQTNLAHGISTRRFGSMRLTDKRMRESLKAFADVLDVPATNIVLMQQTHTNNVTWVGRENGGQIIQDTDALITAEKNTFLAVRTADCVPLLLFDPLKHFVAVVHAGWRGLYSDIISKTVHEMTRRGSGPRDILVGIGPCIGVCCYDIDRDLADKFEKKFANIEQPYISEKGDKVYMNLLLLAKSQLLHAGILNESIESCDICTKDSLREFFSYRGEGAEKFGGFLSLIGMKKKV